MYFNPRSPWWERLKAQRKATVKNEYFNPRSPWGERPIHFAALMMSIYFNPRSPWGERPVLAHLGEQAILFQSTLPVGGATNAWRFFYEVCYISIHAPRGGSDSRFSLCGMARLLFQSTLPVGGATATMISIFTLLVNFNPRSPWGERLTQELDYSAFYKISIHAPRGGSDLLSARLLVDLTFQSTLPVGGATVLLSS